MADQDSKDDTQIEIVLETTTNCEFSGKRFSLKISSESNWQLLYYKIQFDLGFDLNKYQLMFNYFIVQDFRDFSPEQTLSHYGVRNNSVLQINLHKPHRDGAPEWFGALEQETRDEIMGLLKIACNCKLAAKLEQRYGVTPEDSQHLIEWWVHSDTRKENQFVRMPPAQLGDDNETLEDMMANETLLHAAQAIWNADVVLIASGAGWSADSGLATYPGVADIPPYHEKGLDYMDLCNPAWVRKDPKIHFGFWGDCADVYRDTVPHAGYDILQKWKTDIFMRRSGVIQKFAEIMNVTQLGFECTDEPFFSLTSNVDAHWWNPNIAGGRGPLFNRKECAEVHGNVEFWQCTKYRCQQSAWPLPPDYRFNVDRTTMECPTESFLRCPHCNTLARPQILMFGDGHWEDPDDDRKYITWRDALGMLHQESPEVNCVVIEIGAGQRVPTIRSHASMMAYKMEGTLIRINPDAGCLKSQSDHYGPEFKYIPIKSGGLAALRKLDQMLDSFAVNETMDDLTAGVAGVTLTGNVEEEE